MENAMSLTATSTLLGFVAFALLVLRAHTVQADSANIPAVADATLLGGTDATTNQSLANPGIFVGTDGTGNPKRGLIEFNIAGSVPAGATITGVQLQLTVGQSAGSGGGTGGGTGTGQMIGLFDETQTWGQPTNIAGSIGFAAKAHGAAPQNGDATWNNAFYNSNPALATPWAVAGGNCTASSTDIADTSVAGTLTTFIWSSPAMLIDVQKWLNNPASNFGWLLKSADESVPTNFRAFWSAQGTNAGNPTAVAPNLVVTFVPEPLGMGLIAFAAPILRRRRQRQRAGCC
jgi:hypothetical protein